MPDRRSIIKPRKVRKGNKVSNLPRDPVTGKILPGKGRIKGSVNKATKKAREALADLIDGNAHRLAGWLNEIYDEHGAAAAFDKLTSVLEYHVPKLQRNTIVGNDDGPVQVQDVKLEGEALEKELLRRGLCPSLLED